MLRCQLLWIWSCFSLLAVTCFSHNASTNRFPCCWCPLDWLPFDLAVISWLVLCCSKTLHWNVYCWCPLDFCQILTWQWCDWSFVVDTALECWCLWIGRQLAWQWYDWSFVLQATALECWCLWIGCRLTWQWYLEYLVSWHSQDNLQKIHLHWHALPHLRLMWLDSVDSDFIFKVIDIRIADNL